MVALGAIASTTAGNNVGPDVAPTARARHDMVDVLCPLVAVLTTPVVPPKYGLTGDGGLSAIRHFDEIAQLDNRRKGNAASLATNQMIAFSQHINLPAKSKDDGPTTWNDPDWFEGGIQDQSAGHGVGG